MNANNLNSAMSWVDPDDAPELTQADFAGGVWEANGQEVPESEGKAAMRKALRGRPTGTVKDGNKVPVKLRLDADVVAVLKLSGKGWQTRANETLRAALRLAGKL